VTEVILAPLVLFGVEGNRLTLDDPKICGIGDEKNGDGVIVIVQDSSRNPACCSVFTSALGNAN
jgi:hypothetical protein